MRGLNELRDLNDREAAEVIVARYERLCERAVARGDLQAATRYDGWAEDFRRSLEGSLKVWPDRRARREGLFQPSRGIDFRPR